MENQLILIIDDDTAFAETQRKTLALEGYTCVVENTGQEGIDAVTKSPGEYKLVLLDLRLPDVDGLSVLRSIKSLAPELPVVIFTGFGTVQNAVEAIRYGALDFILKPFPRERLISTVKKSFESQNLVAENRFLKEQLEASRENRGVAAASETFNRVLEMARQVAPTDTTILITGETGTGKERVANLLYGWSKRKGSPFLKVNCAALSENLLESQLFGHRRGAFTGANEERKGFFEEANGGTIFLDEIGDVSPALQKKLLRVLQEGEFIPVGNTSTRKTDVRILAATNRNLSASVRSGIFREDLYYRLNVFSLKLPPLRERVDDIPLLVEEFVGKTSVQVGKTIKGLTVAAMDACMEYCWPGNIRELQNVMERASILCQSEWIDAELLGIGAGTANPDEEALEITWSSEDMSLKEIEGAYVEEMLWRKKWSKSHTAKILGISRNTLDRKIKEYGLEPPGGDS